MPRQARIDAPGVLHHVIIRGIERKRIFTDDRDRQDFLERLSGLFEEKTTPCYAWALMNNYGHLLLRTGTVAIASKRQEAAHARAVVSHIATQGLSISGSDAARRLSVDRSAVSRAVGRVQDDQGLMETVGSIPERLGVSDPSTSQH